MNELRVFQNSEFGEVRTVTKNGEPWFVAADVCRALEIGNPTDAVGRLDEDERTLVSIEGASNGKPVNAINEPGLYSLVLGSRKPEARAFKRWITHEVIPAIRKHGIYATPQTIEQMLADPDTMIVTLQALKAERERRLALEDENAQHKQIIAELQPKASYYDVVLQTPDAVSASQIAKDYGKSARWLNEMLHGLGIQFKQGDVWLLYQKHAERGYTRSKTHTYSGNDGRQHSKLHTYWTQKGRLFIYDLLKRQGIYPQIEIESSETA